MLDPFKVRRVFTAKRDGCDIEAQGLLRDLRENLKLRLLKLHKAIAPLRDALLNLRHTESPFISDHVSVYMRDAFENILQLLNMVETYREVLSTSSEMMMTVASNRMNETITFLTIISSFFIPLTFIVGFYGMNLRMPETQLSVTYPVVIALMAATVLLMFLWFRRKKWL
ncbi:Cobalt/magnesium transport protein CorA [bioreactor metagenome]|uniref:Cobalt/magnesium transport protein CorA n=1 Tax=bioreactor metagenome TaxID=1076179 RepID=A0A645GU77_9ZZZZ